MKKSITLSLCLVLLAGSACMRQDLPQKGRVVLEFSIGQPETRANITPGVTGPEDGGAIFVSAGTPDLNILISNSSGDIVARYPDSNPADGPSSGCEINDAQTRATVTFSGLDPGEYMVYAVANTSGGVWGAPANQAAWDAISTATALEALTLSHGSDPRPSVTDRMPLSASGPLTVASTGNGEVGLELLRCAARVSVQFENVTSGNLVLGDSSDEENNVTIDISSINPTEGRLIPPSSGDDVSGTLGTLAMSAGSVIIPKGETATLSETSYFVFPSVAPAGTYYCSANFSWTQTTGEIVTSGSYSHTPSPENPGLRVHDKKSSDIPALGRNQHITILIRIANNSDISFNFIVSNWEVKTEKVAFD